MSELILPTITELSRPFWEGCAAGVTFLYECHAS